MVTIATVELFETGLLGLREKIDKLNRRAEKHGMIPVEISIRAEKTFFPVYKGGIGPARPLYIVDINGVEPCIDGWRLGARIEFNPVVGPVVRTAPGVPEGEFIRYSTAEPICEHCNTNRKRNDIFVLIDSAGTHKLVGRNCLADFVRDGDAESLVSYAEFCDRIRSVDSNCCEDLFDEMGGYRTIPTIPLGRFLPIVAMLTRRIGWVSRTMARENDCTATADRAGYYLYGKGKIHREWIENNGLFVCDEDKEIAVRAVEWAKTVDTSRNEYLDTIKKIACAGQVDMRTLDGYAASIIIAYRKACEREALEAERAKTAKKRIHYGIVGKREKGIKAICAGRHSHEGYYGVTTILRFEVSVNEEEKAVLVWFASGDRFNDFEEGVEYTFDATIKSHDDDARYGKDTKVNRLTIK